MSLLDSFVFNNSEEIISQIQQEEGSGGGSTFVPFLKNEFKATADSSGNGSFVARILPALQTFKNKAPHIHTQYHKFSIMDNNGNIHVYDSTCPGFFNDDCPVCSFIREEEIYKRSNNSPYSKFYNGVWQNRRPVIPQLRAREERYFNIYIVEDQMDPMNNGKIFQYKAPMKIFKLYEEALKGNPVLKEAPYDPSHLIEGRNLYVAYENGSNGLRNYDKSTFFAEASPISDKDGNSLLENREFIEYLQNELQDLYDIVDPETRSYTPQEAKEKFALIRQAMDEKISSGGANQQSISDGFDKVQLKKDTQSPIKQEAIDPSSLVNTAKGASKNEEVNAQDSLDEIASLLNDTDDSDSLSDYESELEDIMKSLG